MDLNAFLNPSDAMRAEHTIRKLPAAALSRWALAGGLAIELHILARGGASVLRPLHDIDFIARSFEDIPPGIAEERLLSHVHPHDPPGKTILQCVDLDTKVRLDVFRAYGAEMERAEPVNIAGLALRMVSFEDLVARHARLNWDLIEGQSIAPKFARDFLRMAALVSPKEIQSTWQEHRKPPSPESFAETLLRLREAIEARRNQLVPPVYSTDTQAVCHRCEDAGQFPLADATQVLDLLGYC